MSRINDYNGLSVASLENIERQICSSLITRSDYVSFRTLEVIELPCESLRYVCNHTIRESPAGYKSTKHVGAASRDSELVGAAS